MVDILDLSEELKNFKHNGVSLNLDERYVNLNVISIVQNATRNELK